MKGYKKLSNEELARVLVEVLMLLSLERVPFPVRIKRPIKLHAHAKKIVAGPVTSTLETQRRLEKTLKSCRVKW
jgi:hypothetical protein